MFRSKTRLALEIKELAQILFHAAAANILHCTGTSWTLKQCVCVCVGGGGGGQGDVVVTHSPLRSEFVSGPDLM